MSVNTLDTFDNEFQDMVEAGDNVKSSCEEESVTGSEGISSHYITCSRGIMFIFLMLSTVAVGSLTYILMSRDENKEFEEHVRVPIELCFYSCQLKCCAYGRRISHF